MLSLFRENNHQGKDYKRAKECGVTAAKETTTDFCINRKEEKFVKGM